MQNRRVHQIVYFDTEGRSNLPEVIRVVKQKLKSREELRSLKLIMLTAEGEGPLLRAATIIANSGEVAALRAGGIGE